MYAKSNMSVNKPSLEASSSRTETIDPAADDTLLTSTIKLDPTPPNDPNDPLNWPMWLKIATLTQTSLLAAIGGLNTAAVNPALKHLSEDFNIDIVKASYQTTVCIALNGIAPWIWIPLAKKYGRRPVYLATTLLAFVSILGCAYAKTYTQLLVCKFFNGLFPAGFALGATSVTDLFYIHQHGRAMGFFTVTVVNGSHLAPIIGGLLGHYCGWRWIFKFLAIIDAVLFLTAIFCLPETRYIRTAQDRSRQALANPDGVLGTMSVDMPNSSRGDDAAVPQRQLLRKSYLEHLRICTPDPAYKLRPTDFVLPTLRMALYPSVFFPAVYYAAMYGFASILPAVTVAAIFTEYFHWNTLTIGLSYGASLTIGGILGEAVSGWVCDLLYKRAARAKSSSDDGNIALEPEVRLTPIWAGEFITVAGLLMYGFTLQRHAIWFLPVFAMGMSCFGLQIITTTTYTYSTDAHRKRSAETAQFFNFVRQMFGMTFAFYVVRMGHKIGFQWTFLIFAICGGVLAFLPVVGLMVYGKLWRAWATEKWRETD